MFVKRLEIENIRSFKCVDIKLSKGINIIAGGNNAGKSTLLKALYKLQEPGSFRIQDMRINCHNSAIRIILEDISEKDALLFQNLSKHANILPNLPIAEVFFPLSSSMNEAFYFNTIAHDHISLNRLSSSELRERFKDIFPYFPDMENRGNFIYPFFAKRRGGFSSSSISRDETYHVLEDFRNLPSKVQKVSNQNVTKRQFAELCKDILGFEVGIYTGENGENRIGLYTGYKDKIPLESMGEGTANILGLITLLLTEDNKLFLLEELENDIHPLALKKLLALITEKSHNNQFVISTHSNILLKYLGASSGAKIFFTELSIQKDTIQDDPPTSTVSEISNSPVERLWILERLGYELYDYDLYKGYLIFEESSAEKIIRDYLIPLFVPDLRDKIKTVASQGVSDVENKFHGLNTLFMYLHRSEIYKDKAWILVDGDNSGKNIIEKLRNIYQAWNPSHFISFNQPYFELYYPSIFSEDVSNIISMKRGVEKQKSKAALLEKIFSWIEENPESAKKEFQISASEIISKLQAIDSSLRLSNNSSIKSYEVLDLLHQENDK